MRRDYQTHLNPGYPVTWPKSGNPNTTPNAYSGMGTDWDYVHRSSGCWNNLACVEAIWFDNTQQKEAGWNWSTSNAGTINFSNPIYFRYRVKFLNEHAADNNKAFIWNMDAVERLM